MTEINNDSLLQVLKKHIDPTKVNGLLTEEEIMGKIQEVYKENVGRSRFVSLSDC